MRYCPVPSLMTVRLFSMRAGLDASTVTPGRTAADASRMTPAIVAWACTLFGSSRLPASATATNRTRRITNLLLVPDNPLTCGSGGYHTCPAGPPTNRALLRLICGREWHSCLDVRQRWV